MRISPIANSYSKAPSFGRVDKSAAEKAISDVKRDVLKPASYAKKIKKINQLIEDQDKNKDVVIYYRGNFCEHYDIGYTNPYSGESVMKSTYSFNFDKACKEANKIQKYIKSAQAAAKKASEYEKAIRDRFKED